MSNKIKRKALIPAIAMVLVSVVALSGVSYAWFTVGNTATVEALKFNVQSASGIQISLTPTDPASWRSTVTESELATSAANTSLNNAYPGARILPLSTNGSIETGVFKMFKGTILNSEMHGSDKALDGKLESVEVPQRGDSADTHMIAFDLYIKSDSDQVISLDNGTGITPSATNTKNSHWAVRMGMINYGSTADMSGNEALGLTTPVASEVGLLKDKSFIWEPYALNHLDSANTGVLSYKGLNTATKSRTEATASELMTVVNGVATAPVGSMDTVLTQQLGGDTITGANVQTLMKVTAGISKIRIYVWMEGQDADCLNEISGGDLIVNIVFSKPSANPNG